MAPCPGSVPSLAGTGVQDRAHPEESHSPLQRCDEKREKPEEVSTKRYKRREKLSLQKAETPRASGRRRSRSDRAGKLVATFLQIVSAACMSMCVPAAVVKVRPSQEF